MSDPQNDDRAPSGSAGIDRLKGFGIVVLVNGVLLGCPYLLLPEESAFLGCGLPLAILTNLTLLMAALGSDKHVAQGVRVTLLGAIALAFIAMVAQAATCFAGGGGVGS